MMDLSEIVMGAYAAIMLLIGVWIVGLVVRMIWIDYTHVKKMNALVDRAEALNMDMGWERLSFPKARDVVIYILLLGCGGYVVFAASKMWALL